jgi:glycosyltransferase involved in cell wall biosynthesis
MKTLKVLYVTDALANGGAERQLALLVRNMPPEWKRLVWSLKNGSFAQVMKNDGIPLKISERKWRFDFRPAFDLWKVIADWQPDVIHCLGWMGLAAAFPACKFFEIPVIGSIRTGMLRLERGYLRGYSHAYLVRFATRVIANSHAGIAAWKIPSGKAHVIYNGFDSDRLQLCLYTPKDNKYPFTAIMAARMSSIKDYDSFFDAAVQLAQQGGGENWRFVAVGSGSLRSSYIDKMKIFVESKLVSFPDPGIEILPHIAQANVGVLMTNPEIQEGCSNSIMEYMACGLPVICSNSGGNSELVTDGKTGFVIPPGNSKALIEKLTWLRNNRNEAIIMGALGRERILRDFTINSMVNKTLSVYRDVIKK